MEKPVLSDQSLYPSDEVVFSHIGKHKDLWVSFFDFLREEHPDLTSQWRYYRDGGSWLLKAQRKTKTVFWLSLAGGTFRATFYFPVRAEEQIAGSSIPDELKEQFTANKSSGKIKGITLYFRTKKDLKHAGMLVKLKNELK